MNRYIQHSSKISISDSDQRKRYGTLYYPRFEHRESDTYIIPRSGDRLDLIAYDFYKDTRLWWVIKVANNLPGGTLMVEPGKQLRIPNFNTGELQELIEEAQF